MVKPALAALTLMLTAAGSPAEIRDNPAVIAAYLGVDEEDAS